MDYQWSELRDFLQTNAQEVRERSYNNYNLRFFTQKEIEDITNGYSVILGEGGFGMVYKGKLDDQRPVAVKRYKHETKRADFAKEVTVHSQINHKNVVRLFGCCTEENALMIVMEFICNGNLYDMLHCSNGVVPFPLEKRLDIAIESAEALSCMHSMYSPVLHGDIKPANILLDENCLPKISDFGIARLLSTGEAQHTENVIGPRGYMDPLYINTGKLTPKSDVYSFGVVLLEIITRKKAVDGNTILAQSFDQAFGKAKKMRQLFDEKIATGKKNTKLLEDIAKLAVECLRLDDKLRPQMIEVADRLRMIRKALPQRRGGNGAEPSASPGSTAGSNYVNPSSKTSPIITLDELKSISKHLSPPEVLGCGPHTTFFLGTQNGSNNYVIKKLDASLFEEFQDQVQIISKLKHKNVVRLFGHFVEGNVHVFAYEYASMGSLQAGIRRRALSWKQRVRIALSAAKGLEFLHEKAEPPIIHKKIKSSNILLYGDDVAKIEYLGVSRQPYYRSDYNPSEPFSMKSDIYSFGVVLLEILTGQLADDCNLPGQSIFRPLVTWAIPKIRIGKVEQCVDPALGGLYSLEAVAEMAALAALCVQDNACLRPSMNKVVQTLSSLSNNTSGSLASESTVLSRSGSSSLPSESPLLSTPLTYVRGDVIYVSTDGVAWPGSCIQGFWLPF